MKEVKKKVDLKSFKKQYKRRFPVSRTNIVFSLSLFLLVGLFFGYLSKRENPVVGDHLEVVKESEFELLNDVPFQIIDTQYFSDADLGSWYAEKRKEAGEYTYESSEGTYVLISIGKVKNENTFLLLNGVKEKSEGKVIIGYDQVEIEGTTSIKLEDKIRATLILLDNNYGEIRAVRVEEEKQ